MAKRIGVAESEDAESEEEAEGEEEEGAEEGGQSKEQKQLMVHSRLFQKTF